MPSVAIAKGGDIDGSVNSISYLHRANRAVMIFRHAKHDQSLISRDRKAIAKVKAVNTISRIVYETQEASPGKIAMLNAAWIYVSVLYCVILASKFSNRSKT